MTKSKQDDTLPTTFPSKYLKVLTTMPDFKQTADAASTEELKKMIVLAEGNIYEIEASRLNDAKLNAAKEVAKDASAPYKDAINCQTAKAKYAIFLLQGKGVDTSDIESS